MSEVTKEIKSFAFFDIETTGLPSEEYNKTKITELSLVACSKEHLLKTNSGDLPRVLHKLTLCINPFRRIAQKSEEITGLSNELLEHENKFDTNAVETISHFLSHLQKPCLLVAHNGLRFDFPVLKRMLELNESSLNSDLLVADSLRIFREIDEYEEFLKAEASVRPLTPDDDYDEKLLDNFIQKELDETNESIHQEEEAIDNHIQQELKEISPILTIPVPEKGFTASELQKLNETTPVKPSVHSINNNSMSSSLKNQRTKDDPIEIFNKNRKRVRDVPLKSRRDLFGAKKPFKLMDVYQRCYNEPPEQSHYAEGDVITLIKCAIAKKEEFIRIAQEQAILFKEIRPLGK